LLLKITEVSLSIQAYVVPYGLTSHIDTFLDTFLGTNRLIQRRKCLIYIW